MEGFVLPNKQEDTPSCYLVVCRKLVQCYLRALAGSISPGMTLTTRREEGKEGFDHSEATLGHVLDPRAKQGARISEMKP